MNYKRIIAVCAFVIFALTSCVYNNKKCQKLYAAAATQTFDVIVVPGIAYDSTGWSFIMKSRIYWAKYLFDKGIAKNIMFSGSSVYTKYIEAEIMKEYAIAIGIPSEHIYVETKAEHSTENIYYSYKKAKLLKLDKVALATDPLQAKMLTRFIRKKVSKSIVIIPMDFKLLKTLEPTMVENPKIDIDKAIANDFVSIKERQGFFKRLRGTAGKNINKSYYNQ